MTEEKSVPVPDVEDLKSGSSGMGMAGGIAFAVFALAFVIGGAICACLLCK